MRRISISPQIITLIVLFIMPQGGLAAKEPAARSRNEIKISLSETNHTMAGGIGASWHAMSRDLPYESLAGRKRINARGSAWGGNPPLDQEGSWQHIEQLASWLGMDFVRVELEQRMYEPKRNTFDWDNEEMKALYRILDWCERNKADVFLTQMWSFVDWNAHPGVPSLQSSPRNMDDFAKGLATLVEYLIKQKKYTCIQWICIVNEPSGNWAWWLGPGNRLISITPGLKAVRAELDKRGISIPLSAPDYNNLGGPQQGGYDFDSYIGAYDCHSYKGADASGMKRWADFAHSKGKPFLLTEMGDMSCGWGGENPGPAGYKHALSIANKVLSGLASGVDAFNRWSFTNRGDLDGQWQMIRTWDRNEKRYLDEDSIKPEPIPYYSYAMFTRFLAKHSTVLRSEVAGRDVAAAALRSPKGNLTFIVLNNGNAAQSVAVHVDGLKQAATLHCYQITEAAVSQRDFKLNRKNEVALSVENAQFTDNLPGSSITAYTTYHLAHADAGISMDFQRRNDNSQLETGGAK
ncbi:MAG: cellulase family glycosylhydrolase [Kiritimatiellaeota bacterium]|nr:cellulase family glycosylhydrolase [Kiritimatiellota bacterium]